MSTTRKIPRKNISRNITETESDDEDGDMREKGRDMNSDAGKATYKRDPESSDARKATYKRDLESCHATKKFPVTLETLGIDQASFIVIIIF